MVVDGNALFSAAREWEFEWRLPLIRLTWELRKPKINRNTPKLLPCQRLRLENDDSTSEIRMRICRRAIRYTIRFPPFSHKIQTFF